MKNTIFLLLTLCVLCQCSCKKSLLTNDDDTMTPMTELEKLPPVTSEGANTFGCLVNGEAWTPKGYIFPESNFDVYFSTIFNGVFIQMYKYEGNDVDTEFFTMDFNVLPESMELDTTQNLNLSVGPFICTKYRKILDYEIEVSKLDTLNKIVAGTFEYVATVQDGNSTCQDTIYITNGRFDAIYRY